MVRAAATASAAAPATNGPLPHISISGTSKWGPRLHACPGKVVLGGGMLLPDHQQRRVVAAAQRQGRRPEPQEETAGNCEAVDAAVPASCPGTLGGTGYITSHQYRQQHMQQLRAAAQAEAIHAYGSGLTGSNSNSSSSNLGTNSTLASPDPSPDIMQGAAKPADVSGTPPHHQDIIKAAHPQRTLSPRSSWGYDQTIPLLQGVRVREEFLAVHIHPSYP
jgi:hypothetical protein